MKTSYYNQIIDWNERRGDRQRLGVELIQQIDALLMDVSPVAENSRTVTELLPIRLVTTLEVFLRGVIAELIDGSEQYFERGEKLAKGEKIDLAFAAHVKRQELTIGDFIAHAVSLNNIASVISVLDTLLESFATKLKSSHPRWSEEIEMWPLPPIIDDYDMMMASLARLFEVRHILTHELPQNPILKLGEVQDFASAAKAFISATDWVVIEALHGAVPRTQLSMNLRAHDNLLLEEERLAETLREVEACGVSHKALSALQESWAKWAEEQAVLVAAQVEDGSMYPMLFAMEKAVLTRERRDQLMRLKAEWMDP